MRVWILAVVLVFSMLPSMEAVEAAVHLVEHGDLGNHDEGHDLGTDEHGCSGTFHLCDCHGVNAVPHLSTIVIAAPLPQSTVDNFGLSLWIGLGATAPPIRPPIT